MNRSFAVLSLALLLLTGCSGSDKSRDAAGSVSPARSASVSASAGNAGSAGSSGAQADAGSSSSASSTSTEAKPAPTFGPNHQELELTAEEQAAYQAGEYVPATEKHPALNVPVPVMPEKAKERSYEGATAFVQYWNETVNYAIQTGDVNPSQLITDSGWESQVDLLNKMSKLKTESRWFVDAQYSVTTNNNGFTNEFEEYGDLLFVLQRSEGKIYSLDGTSSSTSAFNTVASPLIGTLRWSSNGWTMYNVSGADGTSYE